MICRKSTWRLFRLLSLILFPTLFSSIIVNDVKAVCLACSELRGVKISMKDGHTHEGYVHWNEAWLKNQSPRFPDSLIDPIASVEHKQLTLYKQIFPITKPVKSVVTTESYLTKVERSQIATITANPMKYDGYDGTSLNLVSKVALNWLTTEKQAAILLIENTGVSDEYIISYNSKITNAKKLKKIFKEEKNKQKLERMRILVMSFAYD